MYDGLMTVLAILLLVGLVMFFVVRHRKSPDAADVDASAALDTLVADAIERELAQTVLGMKTSTDDERATLRKALRGTDADIDLVSRLERAVKSVDLEFIRFGHEPDAEVNVTLSYEDGKTVKSTRRISMPDLPRSVRESFEKNAITRAFLAWQLPWRR
jgi:hypothetical protein